MYSRKEDGETSSSLVARELPRHLAPGTLHAASDAALRVGAEVGRGRVLAARLCALLDEVACATAADVVDGGGVLAETLLLGELLIKGEHGSLLLAVDVACTATAAGEESVGRWGAKLDARCRASGIGARSYVLGETGDVSCSSTAIVDGGPGRGVGLGDVVGDHFELAEFVCLGEWGVQVQRLEQNLFMIEYVWMTLQVD